MRSRTPGTAALLRLLRAGEPEEQCAAAIVLGSLRPRDPRVIPALGRAIGEVPAAVRPYVLDALGRFDDDPRVFRYIAPFLTVEGSLREQAARLACSLGEMVLPQLLRLYRRTPHGSNQALIRVLASMDSEPALDFLVDQLHGADFDTARNISVALRRATGTMPPSSRRHLVGRLLRLLERLREQPNTTSEIAVLKVLSTARDARALTPLLERAGRSAALPVRLNALEGLALAPLPRQRRGTVARRLLPLVEDTEPPSIAAGALRVLRRLEPPALDRELLCRVARSNHPDVARVAIRELRLFAHPDVVGLLLETLRRPDKGLQAAAATALRELEGVTDALVAAHEDPRFADHQETIRTILASKTTEVRPAELRSRIRRLIDGEAAADVLQARLLALAAVNRPAVNRSVEARARAALSRGAFERAIVLLEPLVRNRLATPLGRYLLALAHLGAAGDAFAPGEEHHDRALQLLGPLARLKEWPLERRLAAERRIPSRLMLLLAQALEQRPAPERRLVAALRAAHG